MQKKFDIKKAARITFLVVRRTLLVIFTTVLLALLALILVCNMVFNGPSETARNVLTMSMLESSGMKWCPALFIGKDTVAQIQAADSVPLPEDVSDASGVVINTDLMNTVTDEWKDYPDGIRIERVYGDTYTAHVMLVRNPADVYLATSTERFSLNILGTRIHHEIETEGAIAAINGGAFNDDGTLGTYVGSLPIGLTVSEGDIVWDDGKSYEGFAGFNEDNVLIVANTMTAAQAKELNIRDGCCFGPVLLMNGVVNDTEFSRNSGYNPRTAIGQRADGTVIFVCVDGRQAGSLGGTYADVINIMVEFGAVNACNLDGGASSVMLYRDTYGRYTDPGKVTMINNHAILQEAPRRMPTFFMVRSAGGDS